MNKENYIKAIRRIRGLNCYAIGTKRKVYVYRYMPIDTALKCFGNKNILASQPDQWADKFEGRFYNADYSQLGVSDDTHPRLWAFCTTGQEDCEASWERYRSHNKDIPAEDRLCLQVKINRKKLLKELSDFANEHHCKIYEGWANYFLNTSHIRNLHKKYFDWEDASGVVHTDEVTAHNLFFNNFTLTEFLNLMLIKRKEYEYESEIRYFIIPENQSDVKEKSEISLQWQNVIEEIKVDSRYSDFAGLVAKLIDLGLNVFKKDDSLNKYEQKKYSTPDDPNHIIWISTYDINHDTPDTIVVQK